MDFQSPEVVAPKRKHAIVRQVGGEFIVYDKPTEHAHCLNKTAWDVWQLCDGKTTAAAMIQKLGPGSDEPVWLSLERLEKAGLLENALAIKASNLARRSAIKKLGIAAAIAFPVIVSIVVPTPAQAQS
jgi:hypothetical protein